MSVSVYDARGGLVATNIEPPFPFPTLDDRRQAEAETLQPRGRVMVNRVLRGSTLIGYQVLMPKFAAPPLRGVVMDLAIISTWICIVGLLMWRTLVRPLQKIAGAARSFGEGHMAARTGVDRPDEIGDGRARSTGCPERIAALARTPSASCSATCRTSCARRWRGCAWCSTWRADADAATARAVATARRSPRTCPSSSTLMSSIFSTSSRHRDPKRRTGARDGQPVHCRAVTAISRCWSKPRRRGRRALPTRTRRAYWSPAHVPTVVIDLPIRSWLRRAIDNLLENARKYSPDAPRAGHRSTTPSTRRARRSDRGHRSRLRHRPAIGRGSSRRSSAPTAAGPRHRRRRPRTGAGDAALSRRTADRSP